MSELVAIKEHSPEITVPMMIFSDAECVCAADGLSGSRDSHMALWRIVDDDDDIMTSSVAGCQSYTHWTAGLHTAASDDDDEDDDVDMTWPLDSEPAMKRQTTTLRSGRHYRPLHVPLYYRMKPVSVKPCEKAEKVRAFAYNDIRQVIGSLLSSFLSSSSSLSSSLPLAD